MSERVAIILAAGEGKRMKSDLPKVLNPVGGRPMIHHVIENARTAGLDRQIVVVGFAREKVVEALRDHGVEFAIQEEQLGTGHAVEMAAPLLEAFDGEVAVLCGDVPLLTPGTLRALIRTLNDGECAAAVLTMRPDDPTGYGRIYRNASGGLDRIVEQRELPDGEAHPTEVNSGTYIFSWSSLKPLLARLDRNNDQGEYYLTDTIAMLRAEGKHVAAYLTDDAMEVSGVNSAEQLAAVDVAFRARQGKGDSAG